MATIGIALGSQQTPPILVQPDLVAGPQASATPAQDPSRQDVVTLVCRTAKNGQTRTGKDAQFGEATAFFLAERQSFRAANGSGGGQMAQTPSAPELPVKLTTGGQARHNAAANGIDSGENQAAAAVNAPEQDGAGGNTANLGTNTAISAASRPATSSSDTPLAELAQLDRTLQQIGIDPQSISLFNRMAMLLYANDPAALKILVQTLQSGAQLTTDSTAGIAITGQNQSQAGSLVPKRFSAQGQRPGAQREIGQNRSGSDENRSAEIAAFRTAPPQRIKGLGDLRLTFAAAEVPPPVSESHNTQLGQLLNVMF